MAGKSMLSNCKILIVSSQSVKALQRYKILTSLKIPFSTVRDFHSSSALCLLHIRAGRYKTSRNQNVKLTYEQAKPPYLIGVEKSWNTWNTSNLKGEGRRAETLWEDSFIRKFMAGTFPADLIGEVIIKRRHNIIVVACILAAKSEAVKHHFLIGYTEELLSMLLQSIVKLEVQLVPPDEILVFKRI